MKSAVASSAIQPAAERLGQHPARLAAALCQVAVMELVTSPAPAGDQAEQHGQCLLAGEHQRGHPVAGGETVAAVPAAH